MINLLPSHMTAHAALRQSAKLCDKCDSRGHIQKPSSKAGDKVL